MSDVVYNEDLVKRVSNKYLAVNIASKRARDINADGLPVASLNATEKKKKPVAIATQELVDGKLQYEKSEVKASVPNTPAIFADSEDSDDGNDMFDEEYTSGPESHVAEESEEGR